MTGALLYAAALALALVLIAVLGIDYDAGGYPPSWCWLRWPYDKSKHAAAAFALTLAALVVFNLARLTLSPRAAFLLTTLLGGGGFELVPRRRRFLTSGAYGIYAYRWLRPYADWRDVVADAAGSLAAVILWLVVHR